MEFIYYVVLVMNHKNNVMFQMFSSNDIPTDVACMERTLDTVHQAIIKNILGKYELLVKGNLNIMLKRVNNVHQVTGLHLIVLPVVQR